MKPIQKTSRLQRATLALPLLLLIGCPSGEDSHEGHDHDAGQEHGDSNTDHSSDEHEGHDHDEENSK